LIHVGLFLYFFGLCLLNAHDRDGPFSKIEYDARVLGCDAFAIFCSFVMNMRDINREKFSFTQRVLYILSALCLILSFLYTSHSSSQDEEKLNAIDFLTFLALMSYLSLSISESVLLKYPEEDATIEGKKVALSSQAILILLKPYIWPDATSSSATVNRVRAILTWVCVVFSKICNLCAPMMIGRSLTELSRANYSGCAKNALLFVFLQFMASFFKEFQGLLYLKVAQAAFVQLSELVFFHLLSLSLEWHLMKKLG